ncbi:ankyrin repeat-containing domain protein [Boeremia exigua]|uniref:ankyrin repeat-containing domain protein n=1 Tax=Boeremia exigua TaxID=749465 RepID=UPI001E8D5D41|nr:ankyrin repeat-containing domain protein [Boeremia exigua]KAH6639525.1 ankyrin repeat-containing domain protein [Boeremia exigua]
MHKLQYLQNEIGDHFFNRRDFGACGSGVEQYRVDVDLVRTTLMKSALRLPQAHMSAAISALLSREEPFELEVQDQVCCSLCEGARAPKELTEQGQTHKKLQACRKRLQSHRSFLMHEHHSVRVESEEQRYEELTETFVDETLDVLAKFPDLSEYREKPSLRYKVITPLHQFDEMTYWNLAGSDFDDCLGRTQLHRLLDQTHPSDIDDDWILLEVLRTRADEGQNTQDILGRSLLHVACQKDWERGVRLLLQEGASPGVITVYGSLPLHYAAAQGSVSICKLLLQHENEFDIEAKDCAGKTAKHYAQLWGHRDVSDLLAEFLPK